LTNYKLAEGKSYLFKILRIIEMPPDGEEQFVLESESGSKYLMTTQYYKHYNLKPGQKIICRVDKINCSGKIYLEPEHPGCKVGEMLDFKVIGKKSIINSFNNEETLLLLNDPWERLSYININSCPELVNKQILSCRVERIKKGQLLISYPGLNQPGCLPASHEVLEFTISGMITLAENLEFFVLDLDGNMHFLRAKYFSNYGFIKGRKVECRLLGEPKLYEHYLEPVHPYYEPGKEYWFEYIKTEFSTSDEGDKTLNLVIKDLLGHEYGILFNGEEPHWPSRVKALVKEIRMSKLVLDFIAIE
jgi:hypothetical protein